MKKVFAILVDEHAKKEKLIHEIFNKSRVGNTEFFSVDINLATQLLSAFDGKVFFPEEEKKLIFQEATQAVEEKNILIPNGNYYLKGDKKGETEFSAVMRIEEGRKILLKNSILKSEKFMNDPAWTERKKLLKIDNNKLMEDFEFNSVSLAVGVVVGHNINGWIAWHDEKGEFINKLRK